MKDSTKLVVAWHSPEQIEKFREAWNVGEDDERIIFVWDEYKDGCAITKNRGIKKAIELGAETVVILDDDCFPIDGMSIGSFLTRHEKCLDEEIQIEFIKNVTYPQSRGTPYLNREIKMPVAACMGFWQNIGDYDAIGQLAFGPRTPMRFSKEPIYGKYFPLCGMNLSFKTKWWPWCQFIPVARFDDIWQGWFWQKMAYQTFSCFRLDGPEVAHSRQSNVWKNLQEEIVNIETNEFLWERIARQKFLDNDYCNLLLDVAKDLPSEASAPIILATRSI
jgi:hypothetical protein